MNAPLRDIPPQRKALYYVGLGLTVLGFLLFMSVFVTGCLHYGDFSHFDQDAKSSMARAFGGMALMILGSVLQNLGARGLAGSGTLLDPQRARRDVEPWSRMAGGVVKDVLDEANLPSKQSEGAPPPAPPVKVRCRQCRALNDEDARFCKQCGQAI